MALEKIQRSARENCTLAGESLAALAMEDVSKCLGSDTALFCLETSKLLDTSSFGSVHVIYSRTFHVSTCRHYCLIC